MSQEDRLYFRAGNGLAERVDRFQSLHGFESRSEAVRRLVETGLREHRSPILSRFKDEIVNWSGLLTISAIIVAIVGSTTGLLRSREAWVLCLSLFATAVALLATLEIARGIKGMNELRIGEVRVWLVSRLRGGGAS